MTGLFLISFLILTYIQLWYVVNWVKLRACLRTMYECLCGGKAIIGAHIWKLLFCVGLAGAMQACKFRRGDCKQICRGTVIREKNCAFNSGGLL